MMQMRLIYHYFTSLFRQITPIYYLFSRLETFGISDRKSYAADFGKRIFKNLNVKKCG